MGLESQCMSLTDGWINVLSALRNIREDLIVEDGWCRSAGIMPICFPLSRR